MSHSASASPPAPPTTSTAAVPPDVPGAPATISLLAKWGGRRIPLPSLPLSTPVGSLKDLLTDATGVLPKRQKLVGLTVAGVGGGRRGLDDAATLGDLRRRGGAGDTPQKPLQFLLVGTVEAAIFVDPSDRSDLPEVLDDFDVDYAAGSDLWERHAADAANLTAFTASTAVHVMHEPRVGLPLLVLDLDHTLLDFSRELASRDDASAEALKRPGMDGFLARAYLKYDLVVWSQTSWRWLEVKLTELGMLTNPHYRFCFVLDKTSMFSVVSSKRGGGKTFKHQVKPLEIIWRKFPQYHWSAANTVHVDDLSRNFALNLECGLKIKAYYRKKDRGRRDCELGALATYLERLAAADDFTQADFRYWADVAAGKMALIKGPKK
mmetsp:Transcript_25705/g.51145  ORF Transcript_25705/g.51145 Transcript_25705/m.51145 type:complete len:379 (+) Transcript_25705:64-1200(+)